MSSNFSIEQWRNIFKKPTQEQTGIESDADKTKQTNKPMKQLLSSYTRHLMSPELTKR